MVCLNLDFDCVFAGLLGVHLVGLVFVLFLCF